MSDPKPGDMIGPWLLLKELGEGGFATVFAARHSATEEHRALKILRREWMNRPDARERLHREYLVAGRIAHENIRLCHAFVAEAGVAYLVLDLLEGTPLDKVTPRDCSPANVLRWFKHTAAGIANAHSQQVSHRDIKPANLFRAAPGGAIKVLDFGIASDHDPEVTQITQVGAVMGTPPYIAPEVWEGGVPDWDRVDVYALGITFHELFSGQHPLASPHERVTLQQSGWRNRHVNATPERLVRLAVPIGELLMSMLAKDPRDRPSAREVERALGGIDDAGAAESPGSRTFVSPPPGPEVPPPQAGESGAARTGVEAISLERGAGLGEALAQVLEGTEKAALLPAEPSVGDLRDAVATVEEGYALLLHWLVEDLQLQLPRPRGKKSSSDLSVHFLVRGPTANNGQLVRVVGRSAARPAKVYNLADEANTVPFPLVRKGFLTGLETDFGVIERVDTELRPGGQCDCPRFVREWRERPEVQKRYGSVFMMCMRFRPAGPLSSPAWDGFPPRVDDALIEVPCHAILCVESGTPSRWDREEAARLCAIATPYLAVLKRSLLTYVRAGDALGGIWTPRSRSRDRY